MRDDAAIERVILALADPPRDQLRAFVREGRTVSLAKGEHFCAPGDVTHRVGFVHTGLLRYHVVTERGDDVTKDFAMVGAFCASFGSALLDAPAAVALTALEATTLTVWPFARMRAAFELHAEWQRLGRRIAELLYLRKERRELDFLLRSATERVASARHELGASFARIPRAHLASYVGIAPESLSRLHARGRRSPRAKP